MVMNSLSFYLSVKLLIPPSYLNEILAGYSNLGCRLLSFITLSMSCHSLLAWTVSIERSAVILMGIPLCVICCFSLAAFNICSLCLIFVNLINMCLGTFCLVFILFGTHWAPWAWVVISFPILGKFSTIISSSIFSWSFFLSSSSRTPMIQMLGHLTLSQRSLRLSSFLLIRLSFFLSVSFISTILSSTSLILSSASIILLLVPSRVFFKSHLLHFSSYIDSFLFLLKWCEVAQLCPTICDPIDCSLPGPIHEIFQARILEWVAFSFSRGSFWPLVKHFLHFLNPCLQAIYL